MRTLRRLLQLIAMLALPAVAHAVPVDRILAIVNDDIVTENEFRSEFRRMVRELQLQGARLPGEDVLQRQVLERIIVDRLQ
ncbi:MAG: molecular chaperone SurA, partial [Gammaproteobacteria bacterium]|nr:molecular chaperone SurA [Gammaproteobacteria bacterium]